VGGGGKGNREFANGSLIADKITIVHSGEKTGRKQTGAEFRKTEKFQRNEEKDQKKPKGCRESGNQSKPR